jgi:cell wall-associated NlpC family hydrolase
MNETEARARVEAIVRSWIGTPFHDHARVKGAGCDCATLLLCVYEEAGLIPHTDVGYYSPQFFNHQSEERYLRWVQKFAGEIAPAAAKQGDIALWKIGKCFAHAAIIIAPGWPNIVHAHAASRCVRRGNGRNPHLGKIIDLKFFSLWAGRCG